MRIEFTGNWYLDAGAYGLIRAVEEGLEKYLGKGKFIKWTNENTFDVPENAAWAGYLVYLMYTSGIWAVRKQYSALKNKNECKDLNTENAMRKSMRKFERIYSDNIRNLLIKNKDIFESQTLDLEKVIDFAKEVVGVQKNALAKLSESDVDCYNKVFGSSKNKKTLKDLASDNNRIIMHDDFLHNYKIFNPGNQNIKGLKSFIKELSSFNWASLEKKQNKFLFSVEKFPNENYLNKLGRNNLAKILANNLSLPGILVATFSLAFTRIRGKYVFVHLPIGKATYFVNKKISEATETGDKSDLVELLIDGIVSSFIKLRSELSLREISIITYEGINKQKLVNVDYIIIPKERAAVVTDDKLGKALDKQLSYREGRFWLLEKFLTQPNIFDLLYRHVRDAEQPFRRAVIYGAISDAATSRESFSPQPFDFTIVFSPATVVTKVKRQIRLAYAAANEARAFINTKDVLKLVDLTLATPGQFVNYILRKAVDHDIKYLSHYLTMYILENANKPYWRNYALALAVAVMGGGVSGESERVSGNE